MNEWLNAISLNISSWKSIFNPLEVMITFRDHLNLIYFNLQIGTFLFAAIVMRDFINGLFLSEEPPSTLGIFRWSKWKLCSS